MGHTIVDGTAQDYAGRWYSYIYALDTETGRVLFVSYFNPRSSEKEVFVQLRAA